MTTPVLIGLAVFATGLIATAGSLVVRDLVIEPRERIARRAGRRVEQSLRASGAVALGERMTDRIDRAFDRIVAESGLTWSPSAVLAMLVGFAAVLGTSLLVLFDDVLPGLAGAVVGIAAPVASMTYRARQRQQVLREQFPEMLDSLARALRAGESLEQAIAFAGREMAAPMGAEMRRCARQMELGHTYVATMHLLTQRVRCMEVRLLVASLLVYRKTGGNLPKTLDRLARVVRDRFAFRRQFRAATAGGRFATVFIALVGPAFLLYMMTFQANYIRTLFEQPLGWMLLGAAALLQMLGITWMASILRTSD